MPNKHDHGPAGTVWPRKDSSSENKAAAVKAEQCCPGSDADISRRVLSFLHARSVPRWGDLEVEVRNGEAIVAGCVATWHEKQFVTSCCQRVAGVLGLRVDLDSLGGERLAKLEDWWWGAAHGADAGTEPPAEGGATVTNIAAAG